MTAAHKVRRALTNQQRRHATRYARFDTNRTLGSERHLMIRVFFVASLGLCAAFVAGCSGAGDPPPPLAVEASAESKPAPTAGACVRQSRAGLPLRRTGTTHRLWSDQPRRRKLRVVRDRSPNLHRRR